MTDHARLTVLGTAADGGSGPGGEDLLAEADTVFTFPHEAESVALFYAEAWRVEKIVPAGAVARVTAWARARPGAVGVLLVAGDPAADVALRAVLDGLGRTAPELSVVVPAGSRVAPPHGSPSIG